MKTQSFIKKLDENPQEQFRKDIDEMIKNIELSVNPRKYYPPLEVIEFQYFMSGQKYIKNWIQNSPIGYPGRPIRSGCGSFTENISAYVDSILKPHMESAIVR